MRYSEHTPGLILSAIDSHPDSWFTIGGHHLVCQDHAAAGKTDSGGAWAVLSDGCSASPDSDVGARLLTRAATLALRDADDLPDVDAVVRTAARWATNMDMMPSQPEPWCLDATLSMLLAQPDGTVHCLIAGDGVLGVRHRDGTFSTTSIRWDGNAPPYPSYRLNPARRMGWQAHYGTGQVHAWTEVRPPVQNGEPRAPGVNHITSVLDTDEPLTWTFSPEEVDLVVLMSDGAESFNGRHGDVITPHHITQRLLSVKRGSGRFLVRRTRRFVNRECDSLGWWFSDDLSVAGVHLRVKKPSEG